MRESTSPRLNVVPFPRPGVSSGPKLPLPSSSTPDPQSSTPEPQSPPPPTLDVASTPPTTSLLDDIANRPNYYTQGDQFITLNKPPFFLSTCVGILRSRAAARRLKSISDKSIYCAAIYHGSSTLSHHPDVCAISVSRSQLSSNLSLDAFTINDLSSIFKYFPISVVDPTGHTPTSKTSIDGVPSFIKLQLGGLTRDLGIPLSTLGIVCTMITLSIQREIQPGFINYMKSSLAVFYERLSSRRKLIELLMEDRVYCEADSRGDLLSAREYYQGKLDNVNSKLEALRLNEDIHDELVREPFTGESLTGDRIDDLKPGF